MSFLETILNIVFPAKCLWCRKNGVDLCLKCLSEAPGAERESADWIFPVYDYRHPAIKKSLWFFKYKGKTGLARIFSDILYEKMLEELSELTVMENFKNSLLVPIPLSPKRYKERGFNQAELICRELVKINALRREADFTLGNNILIKPEETKHQAHIKDKQARLINMSGTFMVKNEVLIKNKNIILIDDIITTGATLTEAKKILKQKGAKNVIAFTVAH